MTEFGFKIDESQIKGMVAEGLLAQLTGPAREEILKHAVVHLLTPPKSDRYSSYQPPSPLQHAFNVASEAVVRDVVKEWIAGDNEFATRIKGFVGEALVAASADNDALGEKVIEAMSRVITEGWRENRDY